MHRYYKILEINENSSIEEIKQAYRRLAKKYHPDINKSPGAQERFIQINEAYEVLIHEASYAQTQQQNQEQFDLDAFLKAVREEAERQARMRYEKFRQQHEAFRQSGLYDLGLFIKFLGRIVLPFFGLALVAIPIIVSINEKSIGPFFYLFLFWVIGGFVLFDAFQKRKNYFKVGEFYYSFKRIMDIYKQTNESATEQCYYCKGYKANSVPTKITLVKIKDVQLQNDGPMQHYARYDRKEITLEIPRSRKAFIMHSIISVIKIVIILAALVFFPVTSVIWRFIGGLAIAWLLSSVILWITSTHSKNAYLFSYGMLIKILAWLSIFIVMSKFHFKPFDIFMTNYIQMVLVFMVFIDALLEQTLHLPKKVQLFKPLLKRDQRIAGYFDKNFRLYLEIPVWTIINPLIRWIF